MAKAGGEASGSGAAADFEAEIRARATPVLGPEERAAAARAKAALEARYAGSRCRAAAEAQLAKAEEYEAQAAKIEKGK